MYFVNKAVKVESNKKALILESENVSKGLNRYLVLEELGMN